MKKILVLAMALALVAALSAPLAALASSPNTTEITGSISSSLELTAPSAIGFGTMAFGSSPYTATKTDGNVSCNNAAGYTLKVADAMANIGSTAKDATIEGYMWTGANTTQLVLANPLQVKAGTMTSLVDITSQQTAKTTSAPSYNDAFSLSVSQVVTNTDPAGSYTITLIFTATANP